MSKKQKPLTVVGANLSVEEAVKELVPACENCSAYYEIDSESGECRAHPPVVAAIDRLKGKTYGLFLVRNAQDWCREFATK